MRPLGTRVGGSWVLVMAALASACGGTADDVPCAATEEAVLATLDAVMAADNAGDVDAAVPLYTEDVTWIIPSGEVISGRDGITENYRQTFEVADVEVAAEATAVEIEGARATILGSMTGALLPRDGSPAIEFDDTFVMQLVCAADATWRISHLAWSSRDDAGGSDDEQPDEALGSDPEDADAPTERSAP